MASIQAELIFSDFKKRLKEEDFLSLSPTLKLSFYQREYPEFAKNYPLALRIMITDYFFNKDVFDQFIKQTYGMPNSSLEDFCDKQSHYMALVLKHQMESKTKKISKQDRKKINEKRLETRLQLIEEIQSIKSCDKSSVKEFTDISNNIDEQRLLLLKFANMLASDKSKDK
jgi:hypothetical protein